ncbi:MAG TPA: hypothetical protein VHP35_05555 [Terriglobia bacterium]|nr:hypothetical protein [Terriglobia bacterium]
MKSALLLILLTALAGSAMLAQERPGLFFREDWKEIPAATPVTQEHVSHPDLRVTRHGPGEAWIKKSHHDRPADDPYYIWSGEAAGNWAVSLRNQKSQVDLTGLGKIRWRSKQAGFRVLRIVLKTAAGQWLVSDQYDPASSDWRVREFNIGDIRWRRLDITKIVEGEWVNAPDLSRIEEIGFTDLMPGGQSVACSRLDWIEVYGRPVQKQSLPK